LIVIRLPLIRPTAGEGEHAEAVRQLQQSREGACGEGTGHHRFARFQRVFFDYLGYPAVCEGPGFFYVGRGSGGNSIVAYCLEITDVEPIELDLYFERFLNPYRSSPPDFDMDFS